VPILGDFRGLAKQSRLTDSDLTSSEEFVHDLGAGGDHRPQFPAVDDLGCPGGGVPGEAGDLLDGHPAVAEQADEGGPQFTRGPAVPGAGLGADPFEHLPDVPCVQGDAAMGGEYQPGVLPSFPGQGPLAGLAFPQRSERLGRQQGKADLDVASLQAPEL